MGTPDRPRRDRPRLRAALRPAWLLPLGYLALLFLNALWSHHGMWDFDVYWRAARGWLSGQDPYVTKSGALPFLYPPLFLVLFAPFAALPHDAALLVFTIIKFAAVVRLLVIWSDLVAEVPPGPPAGVTGRWKWLSADLFPVFALFAFSAALLSDCFTGNISVFEQLLLWGGIITARRGGSWAGGVLMVAAAAIKPQLILLLPIILVLDAPRRIRVFAGLVAIFLVIWLAQWLGAPALFSRFLAAATAPPVLDSGSPSSLAAVYALVQWAGTRFSGEARTAAPLPLAYALWALIALAGVAAWAQAATRLKSGGAVARFHLLLLTVALYAAIIPAMRRYSFLIMVVPAWYALAGNVRRAATAGLLLFMLPIHAGLPAWGPGPLEIVQDYLPIVLTWIVLAFLWLDAPQKEIPPALPREGS